MPCAGIGRYVNAFLLLYHGVNESWMDGRFGWLVWMAGWCRGFDALYEGPPLYSWQSIKDISNPLFLIGGLSSRREL